MKPESKNNDAETKFGVLILLGLCVGVVALWGLSWFFLFKYVKDPVERGQFGDMFGAVNALFTALAFAGLIYTVLLQRQQLALQQREIVESGETQKKLVQDQIEAQRQLFDQQKTFQEEQRKLQNERERTKKRLRQTCYAPFGVSWNPLVQFTTAGWEKLRLRPVTAKLLTASWQSLKIGL